MNKRAEPFRKAILKSLSELVSQGEVINAKKVIDNAVLESGKSVGKTTLYKKNANNEYIHIDLLESIKESKNIHLKSNGKPTNKDTLKSLKQQIIKLKKEVSNLVDQLVEQEHRQRHVNSNSESEKNSLKNQEVDIYILSAVLIKLVQPQSQIKRVASKAVSNFELKYRTDDVLVSANLEIEEYIKDIENSTLISIFNER